MICEKCGKSNISELTKCAYCGEKMPEKSGCNGFKDILSYSVSGNIVSGEIGDEEMKKLMDKSDGIIKATKMNSLLGTAALGVSVLILISSIIFGCVTLRSVNVYKKTTMEKIEETRKELTEYKSLIESVLEEKEQAKDTVKESVKETTKE